MYIFFYSKEFIRFDNMDCLAGQDFHTLDSNDYPIMCVAGHIAMTTSIAELSQYLRIPAISRMRIVRMIFLD